MRYLKNANFASHPSVRIVKKIIFMNAIINPNGTGKDRQYILNNAHDMLLYSVSAWCYMKTRPYLKVR